MRLLFDDNASTQTISDTLQGKKAEIEAFYVSEVYGLLEIY